MSLWYFPLLSEGHLNFAYSQHPLHASSAQLRSLREHGYMELNVPCVFHNTECLSTLYAVCVALLGAECSWCVSVH